MRDDYKDLFEDPNDYLIRPEALLKFYVSRNTDCSFIVLTLSKLNKLNLLNIIMWKLEHKIRFTLYLCHELICPGFVFIIP